MSNRIPYDQFWSYSPGKCTHCDHSWMRDFSRLVHVDWNDQDWLAAAWLSQAQHFCDTVNGLYNNIPGSAALFSGITFSLQPNYKDYRFLLHPNYGKIFLFIAPIMASHLSGISGVELCWGNDGNDPYYWSFDPDGSCLLSKRVTEALGLPQLIARVEPLLQEFADYQYKATKQFQLFRGYNPSTQQFAQRHELPLVDIVWPNGKTGPEFFASPWLYGFLLDYELYTWQGQLSAQSSLSEDCEFCWFHRPDGDEVKPEHSQEILISSLRQNGP
ncbi:hypothetical protein K435DRAFT_889644 [Dendrothele bispora CBS 962.96]|uniref:Uncharacterized protein n=1 Tax=Dendrothele bispora (strain CBS 962.96) TaxID=1314807 RepID=A0A4S8KQG3_DENBC|nr:hypothetical protein K435DRAFT_889644 [Dendrothele bispora CBS 962.96]